MRRRTSIHIKPSVLLQACGMQCAVQRPAELGDLASVHYECVVLQVQHTLH